MTTELARTTPNDLTRPAPDARLSFQPRGLDELFRFAETIARTSFAPSSKPDEVFAMIAAGRELGLTAMQSLKAFHMIQGKPSMSADGMVAVIRASGLCERWDVMESTPKRAVIVTRRKGTGRDVEKVWTAEDAKTAQLTTAMWTKYPAQMLRHRCASDLARQEYSDVLLGMYTPDELSDGAYEEPIHATVTPERTTAALDAFGPQLGACDTLYDVGGAWQFASQALSDEGTADQAADLVASWLADNGYRLAKQETQALLALNYPAPMLALLDALAGQGAPSAVVNWTHDADIAAALATLPEHHAKTVKMVAARTWCALASIETTQPGRAFGKALDAAKAERAAPAEEPVDDPEREAIAQEGATDHEIHGAAEAAVVLAIEAFNDHVAEIELPGEAVAVWLKHRTALAALPAPEREAAWVALCKRTEEVGKMKNAKVWLKKAIAEEDTRRTPATDSTGAAA